MTLRDVVLGFVILIVLGSAKALAGDVQYEVGGGMEYFAGEPFKSLAPKTGYLMRFGAEAGRKSIFRWMSSLSLLSSSGSTEFNDSGSHPTLTYSLIAGEFDLGFKLAFLAADERLPIQPYIGASGAAMSASFTFPANSPVSSTFPKTDAENFYGYSIFVGVDLDIGKDWGINLEVQQSKMSGTLAKQAFILDGNRVFFNLFFRR